MLKKLILVWIGVFLLSLEGDCVMVSPPTHGPTKEKVKTVTISSYKTQLLSLRTQLQALKGESKKASTPERKFIEKKIKKTQDEIKTLTEKIAHLEKNQPTAPYKGQSFFNGAHASLATMSQFNAVGSLIIKKDQTFDTFSSCTATIVGETADEKSWIGLTAAHCFIDEETKTKLSEKASVEFCFKDSVKSTNGQVAFYDCLDEETIPVYYTLNHPDFEKEALEDNLMHKDVAFFLLPKTEKKISYPRFITKIEQKKLLKTLEKEPLEITSVGYGSAGDFVKELTDEIQKNKKNNGGVLKLKEFPPLSDFGKGYGEENFFKQTYRADLFSYELLNSQLDGGLDPTTAKLIEVPVPIILKDDELILETNNFLAGAARSGDSGSSLFIKDENGKLLSIGVTSYDNFYFLIEPNDPSLKKVIMSDFSSPITDEAGQSYSIDEVREFCTLGNATCSFIFAGGVVSLVHDPLYTWATDTFNALKKFETPDEAIKALEEKKELLSEAYSQEDAAEEEQETAAFSDIKSINDEISSSFSLADQPGFSKNEINATLKQLHLLLKMFEKTPIPTFYTLKPITVPNEETAKKIQDFKKQFESYKSLTFLKKFNLPYVFDPIFIKQINSLNEKINTLSYKNEAYFDEIQEDDFKDILYHRDELEQYVTIYNSYYAQQYFDQVIPLILGALDDLKKQDNTIE